MEAQLHNREQIFYGWKIVAASVVILAFGFGMFFSTNGLFVVPVCESLGLSRAEFTFHRTVIMIASACALPFYGKAIQRFGVKKILFVGMAMLGMVTFGYSFATNMMHFYLLALVNGIFFASVSFMTIGILISDWFTDKKGVANGFAFAGTGVGAAIMTPVISRIIEQAGWRVAYRFMGAFGAIVLLPVIFFLIKDKPAQMGLTPYTSPGVKQETKSHVYNLSFREAIRTSRFWLLSIALIFIACYASSTTTHSVPFLSDIGYSPAKVSAVIALVNVVLAGGKIVLGIIYDRFGTMVGNNFVSVCCITFPIAALFAHVPGIPWVYAVSVGMAGCALSVPVPILINKYFGEKDYPVIFSIVSLFITFGSAVAVPSKGAIFDFTGSYDVAWIIFLVFAVVVAICLFAAEKTYKAEGARL
ncbi:MAG: MFS transporter [Clostridiales bacterium]|nr:MFS transporter [Clostridiales bacterium]